jgi:hypothetical protein
MALIALGRRVGWLDVWGSGARASPDSHRALWGVARLVALLLD